MLLMIEQDTIKLLRECDAGIKMGVSAINEVLEYVSSDKLRSFLKESLEEHYDIKKDLETLLDKYHDDGKEPAAIAKGMSWMKTNFKLSFNESDSIIADLILDGCNMGIKSLCRYLNQYKAADEESKEFTKKLVQLEEKLGYEMRNYL